MRKILAALVVMILAVSLLVGCTTEATETNPDTSETGFEGTLTIAGSTSVQPYSDLLKEAFEKVYPNITVNVQGGGSSAGGTAALSGAADIGALSRELKSSELESGLKPIVIAKDGIAIIVHPDNMVGDLELEQIAKIFSGEIKNWSEVGGSDTLINAINRESSSGTRGAFKDIVLGKEMEFDATFIEQGSTGAVKAAIQSDPNAIGYISLASLDESVKGLSVNGVMPSIENITNGTYLVARPFNYATNGDATDLAKLFIDFTLSDEGQVLAEEMGLIKVQ